MEEDLIEKDDNCIICLDECVDEDYLKFPISKSTCECKYNMHVRCFKECKPECPMCRSKIKSIKINDFTGIARYTNYNELYNVEEHNKKYCFCIFIVCFITTLIVLGVFVYIFYSIWIH